MVLKEEYFGDPATFSIRYVLRTDAESSGLSEACCHLILGGQHIGDPEEPCFLSSWYYALELILNNIKSDDGLLWHPSFSNKSDRELFEIINKANQSESEFDEKYRHLPQVDNSVWRNCHISLDETTDAYILAMIEAEGMIRFLWKGWRQPCPPDKIGKFFSVSVDKEKVLATMESALRAIQKDLEKES